MLVQAAHALETASMRGALAAAQEAAEELRARAEERAREDAAAQEVARQFAEQLQAEASAQDAARGEACQCSLHTQHILGLRLWSCSVMGSQHESSVLGALSVSSRH